MELRTKTSSSSPSTDRTLDLLEALAVRPDGLSLSEMVRCTGLPQNSLFRISQALHARGYLHRRESDKRFSLSNKFFDLGKPRANGKSLVVCAFEAMRTLRDETSETVQLLVRSGAKGVVLEQVPGRHPVQVMGEVGMLVPLYSCAPGKALLAWMHEEERETWFGSVALKSFTVRTRATRENLEQDFAATRLRGYAIDEAEGLEGIHCVAAPIFNTHAHPVAALTVMAPSFRLPESGFAACGEACVRAAQEIHQRILA